MPQLIDWVTMAINRRPFCNSFSVSLLLVTVSAFFTKFTKECQFYCSLSLTYCQDNKTECHLLQFDVK